MPVYEIEHPKTGQKIRLEGDGVPTDADIREAFANVKIQPAPKDGRTPSYDNRVTDKAEIERRRREFVQNTGTMATRAKDIANQAFNPEVQIPAADSVGDFATRVLPQSLTQLGPKMIRGAYDAIKGQTDPIVNSLSSLRPTGQLPGPQMERNAGQTVTGLAEAMTAPTGLMGAERAKEAWLTDPAGSALAVSPLVKPSLRTLKATGEVATAIPRAVIADTARAAANKLTDMTLKQSTVLKPEIRAKNVKTALEGGFLPNSKGVDTLNNTIAATEKALADGITAGDAAQVKGTLDKAISNIESLRDKANRSSDPAANNALIDAEIERLQSHPLFDETGAVNIGTLQKMKVEQGRELAKTYGGEKATQFQNSIDKARVRGIKEELESALDGAFPELASTNRKLGDYYNLKKSLERAANRIENNLGIGLNMKVSTGSGGAVGGAIGGVPGAAIGAGIGTLIGIIEHPAVAPRLALQLYKVSKGKITMKEAKAIVKRRIADLSFASISRSDKKQ